MNINTYFKKKMKEKNMQVDDLIQASGSSKSTIYRVMNGLQKPSDELSGKLIEILNLNASEEQEFNYYISSSNADENIIEARKAVYNLLFGEKTCTPNKIELVYYDDEKYIRTFDNILEAIILVSEENNFSCQIKLINCIQNNIISPLVSTVKTLISKKCLYSIEHLINFSTHDFKTNIDTLASIIPILTLDNYSIKYREDEKVSNYGFFHDFLIISIAYNKDSGELVDTTYYISIFPNTLSACYVVHAHDENTIDFFERNYDFLSMEYNSALSSRRTLDEYISTIRELYFENDVFLYRSHLPLSRVPLSVYKSVLERVPIGDFVNFFLNGKYNEMELEHHVTELLSYAQSVIDATYINKQIDFYTKAGLETFASTGLIQDNLELLPPFNKVEIKEILQSLKTRDLDPKDPLKILILKESYADQGLEIASMDNYGLLIEKYIDSNTPYCIIRHQKLSSLFVDFAKNYAPYMLTMPKNEVPEFIDYLIDTYC